MRTNGRSRSCLIVARASFISARLQLPSHLQTSWLPVAVLRPKKMHDFTWLNEMKSQAKARWTKVEMRTLSLCAAETSTSSVVSVASSAWTLSKGMKWSKTNGLRWPSWKTSDIIWAHALSMMSSSTLSEASLEAQSRRSMIRLKCMMLTKTLGLSLRCVWRTHSGPAQPLPYHPQRSFWLEERTRTETAKCIFSMCRARLGARFTRWISFAYHISPSSSRIKYMW